MKEQYKRSLNSIMEDIQAKRNTLYSRKATFESLSQSVDEELEKLLSVLQDVVKGLVENVKSLKLEPTQMFLAEATEVEDRLIRLDDAYRKAFIINKLMNEFREQCMVLSNQEDENTIMNDAIDTN